MFSNLIEEINKKVKSYPFIEFTIQSFNNNVLILAGSEDFIYYHNFEIHFADVFTIIGNFNWRHDTESLCMEIVIGNEAVQINGKYFVEIGYTIFKFYGEDNIQNYIIARSISFNDALVKYY